MKRKLFTCLLAFAMSATLLGGTLSATAEENKTTASTEDVLYDKEDELVIGSTRDIAPGEQEAYYCIMSLSVWEPLISSDNNGNLLPCLATEWSSNEDCTEWTFKLHENVVFHDGTAFNADAVLANLERHKKASGMSSIQYAYNFDSTYPNFDKAEKIDDYTVKLCFTQPYPMLIENMVNYG
ncbi:MAG: ABC transporter substrate-binding protein, partial [Bacillota bacterium]|nr:ABC transporter substrate-binding protein [Bacillota bacterium]